MFTIDGNSGTLTFSCDVLGLVPVEGRFTKFAGSVRVDEANPSASSMIVTVDATSLSTADGRWVDDLRGPAFFDVARYPAFEFRAATTTFEQPGVLTVTGPLTLKGVTRPVTLHVRYDPPAAGQAEMTADAELDRTEFGMTAYTSVLDDDVDIAVEGVLTEHVTSPPVQ